MDSEDVIELGSSDEESIPPPKKKKPMPNAMVHIPTNLPGLTIKPTKSTKNIPAKGIIIKPGINKPVKQIVTSKPNTFLNPFADKFSSNALSMHKTGNTMVFKNDNKPVNSKLNNYYINPIQIKSSTMGQVKKVPKQNVMKKTISNRSIKKNLHGPTVLNNLPSSITVKKSSIKPANVASVSGVTKINMNFSNEKELFTVNLDDEDVDQPTAIPQWYMRPEEEDESNFVKETQHVSSEHKNLEEQNNKEHETKKYVEITIEDSPIKPVSNNEVGKELPIVIEDSPCKMKDKDENSRPNKKSVSQSKKKLDYPNDDGNCCQVVEIEIDPIEATPNENLDIKSSENDMSPEDKPETTEEIFTDRQAEGSSELEFHPTYQEFIDTCFQLENSDDMKIIVEKKIKSYYRQCPREYVESEEFIDMVSSKIMSMKARPENMYLYMKDIVDELKLQKKMAKSYEKFIESINTEAKCEVRSEEEKEYSSKRLRQIRKLDKTIKKLHRAIQKLEEQEVDFDEEDDSVFLLTERYKERLVRVHAKYCQMTNTKMPSEPRIVIEVRPGRPSGPAKKLEKFINKKVPIGTPLCFPDFHDVLRCVREANKEDRLGWNDMDIKEEARDLFARCGKKLQRRRQENEWRIAASRIPMEKDPAEENENLKRKLNENKLIAAKREAELLNKYVDRQKEMKLEAEEIGDKEAEESPVESDEEGANEVSSLLEDKYKRKKRLKRLIQEKNKKITDHEVPISVVEKEPNINFDVDVKNNDENDKGLQENQTEGETGKPDINLGADVKNNDENDKSLQENQTEGETNKPDINLGADVKNNDENDKGLQENQTEGETNKPDINLGADVKNNDENDKGLEENQTEGETNKPDINLGADVKNNDENDKGLQENQTEGETNKPTKDEVIVDADVDDFNNNDGRESVSSTYNVDSDIDELHLLQKLHSENEICSSSPDTTGSDSPISISDTLECDSDSDIENERKLYSDVISIENSSYSESETLVEADNEKISVLEKSESVKASVIHNLEVDFSTESNIDTAEISNEDSIENILLASSEEDLTLEKDEMVMDSETCVNLSDNTLSISETSITFNGNSNEKDTNRKDSDICVVLDNNDVHEGVLNKNISQSDTCVPKDGFSEPGLILNDGDNHIIECNVTDSLVEV